MGSPGLRLEAVQEEVGLSADSRRWQRPELRSFQGDRSFLRAHKRILAMSQQDDCELMKIWCELWLLLILQARQSCDHVLPQVAGDCLTELMSTVPPELSGKVVPAAHSSTPCSPFACSVGTHCSKAARSFAVSLHWTVDPQRCC